MTVEATPTQCDAEKHRTESLSAQLGPPAVVPGYTARRCLGKGTFGEVWLALDENTGQEVAIKFFCRRGGLDWSMLSREVEKLRLLSNDRYVVQLLEVGWDAEPPFYVMEYVPAGSLDERLANGPMPAAQAVALFRQIVTGLCHAHARGVFHCDLKPANVLLTPDDEPRLADFGQARLPEDHSPALGTWFYMAPEQADLHATPDPRWDVYALGALLYKMLTGTAPYRDERALLDIKKASKLDERLRRYRQFLEKAPKARGHVRRSGVDGSLRDILDRCLSRDPARRFPDVRSLRDALDARALRAARQPLLILGVLAPALLLVVMLLFGNRMLAEARATTEAAIVRRTQAGNKALARLAADKVAARVEQRWARMEGETAEPRLVNLLAEIGRDGFEELETEIETASDRAEGIKILVLAETRPSQSSRTEGLILEHPRLRQLRKDRQEDLPSFLAPEQVARLRERGDDKRRALQASGGKGRYATEAIDDFHDGVGQTDARYAGRWLAAAEPVVFTHRAADGPAFVDPGWVVIVQERYAEAVQPAHEMCAHIRHLALGALGLMLLCVGLLWGLVMAGANEPSRLSAFWRRRAGLPTASVASGSAVTPLPAALDHAPPPISDKG